MKTITKTIQYLLVFGSLLLLFMGCGNSSPVGIQPQMDPVVLSESTGASGSQFSPLSSPIFIASQTSAIQADDYWIAWRDPELGYVAAAKSGLPVTPGEDDFSAGRSNVGRQAAFDLGLSVDIFQPADTNAVLSVGSSANVPPPPPPPSNCEERPRVVCDDCGICVRLPPRPCPTPTPEPTPEPEPSEDPVPDPEFGQCLDPDFCSGAGSFGDPHLYTFDRLAYDFHGRGDYVLNRTFDGQFEIQTRQLSIPTNDRIAINNALAVRLGSHTIILRPGDPDIDIFVDGQPTFLDFGERLDFADGGILLHLAALNPLDRYTLQSATGDQIRASKFQFSNAFNVSVLVPGYRQNNLEGLLGNLNGDPSDDIQSRFGEIFSSPVEFEPFYSQFGESWRVQPGESLFFDEAPETGYPDGPPEPLDPQQQQEAEAVCLAAGIPLAVLNDCILDVAVLGDVRVAATFADLEVEIPETPLEVLPEEAEEEMEEPEEPEEEEEEDIEEPEEESSLLATGLGSPTGIAIQGEDVLVVDNAGSQLLRVDPTGSMNVVATNLHQPYGVAVSGNQILVTNFRGQLLDISPSGQAREITNLRQPLWGITVNPDGDFWVVKHNNANNPQRIGSLSRISGQEQMVASGLRAPYGVVLEAGDPVVITDRQLLRFNPTKQVVVDGLVNGRGLATRDRQLWFSDRDPSTGEGRLRRVSSAGAVEEVAIPEMPWPLSIAVTEDGELRIADGSGRLLRLVQ